MKKTKLLSMFLAGLLMFQTAGIDALATAPSEPALINGTEKTAEDSFSDLPEEEEESSQPGLPQSGEEQGGSDLPQGGEEQDIPDLPEGGEEMDNPDLPENGENKDSSDLPEGSGEGDSPDLPENGENMDSPDLPEGGGEGDSPDLPEAAGETENPGLPEAGGETENPNLPENGEEMENPGLPEESGEPDIDSSLSENTIPADTVSENTLPEAESNLFSIFPGLGENYRFSTQELTDKHILASHLGDIAQMPSRKTASLADYRDTAGEYVPGEVVYLAEDKVEAKQVAEAFGGALDSYSYEIAVISLPQNATVALAVAAAADPDIKLPAVWPNFYHYLNDSPGTTVAPLEPADPEFSKQWQHDYIGTRYAWAAGFKGEGVKVGVIDTGLTTSHPDLSANAVEGRYFLNGADGTPFNEDNHYHGTHVAGIIAADDNGIGGVGIAPDAQIRGYCVGTSSGTAVTSDIVRAVNAAVNDGNDIINMSLGTASYDGNYEKTVNKAYEAGTAIFASAGNDDSDGNNFPASFASTISVGAVDQNGSRAYFSNYGKTVTLSFPGVDIRSTVPSSGYRNISGTSQASPAAAGTAAVILSAREDIRKKTGKDRVNALLAAMKSSTTKCLTAGMGAGTTYLPGVLKIATSMTAPETPVISVVDEAAYRRGANKKDYLAESIAVTLSSKTAVGVDIYYSTSGKTPAYKNGAITNVDSETPYVTGTPIMLTGAKTKTIKAIAVNPVSGKASKVVTKTVTLTPIPTLVNVDSADSVNRIAAGKSLKFTAAITPAYAISNKVVWSVVDAENRDARSRGVTVSNGTVKTSASKNLKTPAGEYTIIATAVGADGNAFNGVQGSCKFTVIDAASIKKVAFLDAAANKAPAAKSIKTTDSKTTDSVNEIIDLKKYLTVTKTDPVSKTDTVLTGENAAAEIVWSSSSPKIATVSDGIITAVAPGKTTIKATSNDGGKKSASYNVTVVQPVSAITISGFTKVAAGKSITLTARTSPANASSKKVIWTIKNGGSLVSINKTNGKITTKKGARGSYTVTATAADGLGAAGTYTISIANEEITKITLSAKKLTLFPPRTSASENKTAALTAKVEGKTNGGATASTLKNPLVTWTSNAPAVASVDQTGLVTAKAPGKATITCAAADGSSKKASCTVTVSVPMSKLVIGPTDGNTGYIAVGKKIKMAAKYYSQHGKPSNTKIKWDIVGCSSTLLQDKVKIDSKGTVSVAKDVTPGGSVTVQATAFDGSGVTSNQYPLYIYPNYIAAQICFSAVPNSYSGYFYIMATAYKTAKGQPDWSKAEQLPDYCTASVTGPKNSGLYKKRVDLYTGGPKTAIYQPTPTAYTSLRLDDDPLAIKNLKVKDLSKMTLTVKLKDGSNLTAKENGIYAVYYPKQYADGLEYTVGYFELKRK